MRKFLKDWNIKKHFVFVLGLYSLVFAAVNATILTKNCRRDENKELDAKWVNYVGKNVKRKAILESNIKEPSGKSKVINGALGMCMIIDLFAYPVIKRISNDNARYR